MKRLLALLLCAVMLVSVTACKKKNQTPPPTSPSGNTSTTTTPEEGGNTGPQYAIDPLVSRFLTDMVTSGAIDAQSIHRSKGTEGMTEEELVKSYEATLNGLPITVRNASYEVGEGEDAYTVYCLQVSIVGGYDQRSQDALLTAFSIVGSALNCGKSNVDSVRSTLESATDTLQDLRVNGNVFVKFYSPIINDPEKNISAPCRMDIRAMDYRVAEE